MDENKPLRTYAEKEVCEDPLMVLGCGHVLPMSSMDGLLELHKAYAMDAAGNWSHAQQLVVLLSLSLSLLLSLLPLPLLSPLPLLPPLLSPSPLLSLLPLLLLVLLLLLLLP